jgi:hypothetical protein
MFILVTGLESVARFTQVYVYELFPITFDAILYKLRILSPISPMDSIIIISYIANGFYIISYIANGLNVIAYIANGFYVTS